VGFSLTGVDLWQGAPAAFDAATGIVPAHRGRGLARKMFDFALPRLRERGVERFLLEVLQVNEPAIKAYRNTGFHITREFDCFELDRASAGGPPETPGVDASAARTPPALDRIVRPIPKERAEDLADQLEWVPSWENSVASIRRIPDEVLAFGAYERDALVGTIVYYPLLNWVMNLTVRREVRRRGIGTQLLAHLLANIPESVPRVRIVNVAHEDTGATAFLESCGFRKFTSQYEMEMMLV
jgi:ribosomal protein S18 acetylase RimI-like enzyme